MRPAPSNAGERQPRRKAAAVAASLKEQSHKLTGAAAVFKLAA